MKTFRGALVEIRNRLADRQPFALARFGDGELKILKKERNPYPEFKYDPANPGDEIFRKCLLDSLKYVSPGYYVGISCPKCVGMERFLWAKGTSGQPEERLTFATLMVNSNYAYFLEDVVPLFSRYETVMVCNRSSSLEGLPFRVARDFRVGFDAWRNDRHLTTHIADYVAAENVRGALFILCAGPFSNILAQALYARAPQNIYLDAGSALDPFLFGPRGRTRRYLRGDLRLLNEVCVWA
jgi:hypothetical protein